MTITSPTGKLKVSLENEWLTLTLDDPNTKNALTNDMASGLRDVLERAAPDRTVRGITLRGEGGTFCSGGDLKSFGSAIMAGDRDEVANLSAGAAQLFHRLAHQPQPVLVLVDGPALAGGLGMVCCADVVAVIPQARFALTEVKLGIPPAQIAPYLVSRLGLPTAKKLMITGEAFGGQEAVDHGLADALCETTEELADYEARFRASVLQCAPAAVAATKGLALAAASRAPEDLAQKAGEAFADCLLSDEGREGIASFLAKKKPGWVRA